ncbi:MAG: hypothetical protein IKJ22_03755 [Paludibacteraceae bacterium]|nr:hypothetical protein [Paludibacteraceae bacterium]
MFKIDEIISHKFPQNEMAKKLLELYKNQWYKCKENILKQTECELPFLVVPTDAYFNSSIKIMILGKKTNSWGNELENYEDQTPENLMKLYDLFVNIKRGDNSLFFDFPNNIQADVPIDTQIIINNLVKIEKRGETDGDKNINNLILKNFNILIEEINILRPDMLILLTGPNYDKNIETFLGDFDFGKVDPFTCREFAQIKFTNKKLPVTYRCYNPIYLIINHNVDIYKQKILELIRTNIH